MSTRSRYVMVNGVKTHYTESGGDGPVIVGIHGGGHGSSGAAGLGKLFDLLGDTYRVIGVDCIGGFGDTDVNAPTPYGLKSRADHVAAFIDVLALDKVTILGNSQGAWCAARYTIMNPDRVNKLVIISSLTIANALGIEVPPSEGMKLLQSYDGTRESMARLMRGLVANPDKITDELIDMRQATASRPGAMDAFSNTLKGIGYFQKDPAYKLSFDMRNTLPEIVKLIPTTIIWGENDIFAVPEVGKKIEALLPGANFNWVKNAGHQAQTDQPEIVADIIRK